MPQWRKQSSIALDGEEESESSTNKMFKSKSTSIDGVEATLWIKYTGEVIISRKGNISKILPF